jgi:hypothetical protein
VTRLGWKLDSIRLWIVLILTQDRFTVSAEDTIASKLFWTHSVELLSDVDHVESLFGLVRDCVSIGARWGNGLRQTYHMLRNHFGRTQWYFEVMRTKWKLNLVDLEIVLVLTQDRCTVCVERIIGLEIILDAPDVTPR